MPSILYSSSTAEWQFSRWRKSVPLDIKAPTPTFRVILFHQCINILFAFLEYIEHVSFFKIEGFSNQNEYQ